MRRTIISVVAAVLLASVGTLVLLGYVRGAEARALAGLETIEVLVLSEDVERGTPAEELTRAVITERIPAKVRANGSVTTLADLAGRVAAVDLLAGEQIVASRFATPAQLEDERAVEIPVGLQEITISVSPQRALGGNIAPGDIVGLYASFNLDVELDGDLSGAQQEQIQRRLDETSKVILHRLLVTNVQLEQLPRAPADDGTESGGVNLAPTGNLLITFAVDVPKAERIVFASEYGAIWLSAQDEDTVEDGSLIRTMRNIYDD